MSVLPFIGNKSTQTKPKPNMKIKTLLIFLMIGALSGLAIDNSRAQSINSMPPVVVKTFPESGSKAVAPGIVEIKVVFSKKMRDKSWSPSDAWQNSTPEVTGEPAYDADHKTWRMKVKLEPGKTYGYWLNSQKFANFRDIQGHSAVPYLLIFETKSE